MRRVVLLAASALIVAGLSVRADQAPSQQPVFRSEVDVIRLDVSVLDKQRRPMHGLTAADFTVYEDGKPQRLVAVSEIDGATVDPTPSAWMRHTASDVASNDLSDKAGDGRVIAIVMDDWNIPYDATELILSAREVARYIVDGLRPSDVAAIVFPQQAGKTQDFTEDKAKLLEAIDRYQPPNVQWVEPTPYGTSGGGADLPYRYSSALARSTCERLQPLVPTVHALTSRLVPILNKRKTVVLVSTGAPVPLYENGGSGCPAKLRDIMHDAFALAAKSNINIYGVDPGGKYGYAAYENDPLRRARRPDPPPQRGRVATGSSASSRHDFLRLTAEYTGARAITDNGVWDEIDDLLAEADSYYLVGYQTSNGKPDGKFRKVEVKVNRSGANVRTRTGYYAPREDDLNPAERKITPTANDLGLSGMESPASLPLRATAVPVARAGDGRDADVALVLTVRLPAPLKDIPETLTLVRNVYDADSQPGPPVREQRSFTLHPTTGDELRYDLQQRIALAPGRYQIRFNATSQALDQSGSVYADVEVPDFTRGAVSMTPIVLGTARDGSSPADPLSALLPVVPTSSREFAANEHVTAFARIFEAGAPAVAPATITARLLDIASARLVDATSTIEPDRFDASRAAPFTMELPLSGLKRGPYLLSLSVALPDGQNVRRDLVFRVK